MAEHGRSGELGCSDKHQGQRRSGAQPLGPGRGHGAGLGTRRNKPSR